MREIGGKCNGKLASGAGKEKKGVCPLVNSYLVCLPGEYALPGEKAIAPLLSYLMIIGHIAAIVVSSESEGNSY